MRAGIALANLLLLIEVTAAASPPPAEVLRFSRPNARSLPRAVASWKNSCLHFDMVASAFTMEHGGRTYVFVSAGLKPAGGDNVRVTGIERTSGKQLTLHATFSAASKGTKSGRKPTQPYDLVSVRDTGWVIGAIPEGRAAPLRMAVLVGVRQLPRVANESRAIKLFSPGFGETVNRTFQVSGVALVFEGTVQMRLATAGGTLLARTFTTAASASDWGYFRKELTIPDSVPAFTQIRLDLFTLDEEKGGETNTVRTPLILR